MLKRITIASIVLTFVVSGAAFAALRAKDTVVDLHKTSLGKVLATSKGRTLYLYTPDGKNKSTCTGSCSAYWPPLLTKGKPVAGVGVKKSLLGTAKRGSKLQVTYAGHPLYTYVGDSAAGQATGEGSDNTWYVVTAAGKKK
jgi:predicted lipoprotein with Yx(FWY)xxD motif